MNDENKRFYYKQDRLKQLRAFCHAARTQNISRAAEQLSLSQPTVSLQVKALENQLATRLFERRGPRIALTPEGQALLELASPLVEGLDNLPSAFAERRGQIASGELDIAAGESTILYLLPKYIVRFSAQYPNVQLRIHNVTGRDGLAQLRADAVDFAVGPMLDLPADIVFHQIFAFQTRLVTPREHPLAELNEVTLADISQYGLILPPRHLNTRGIVDLVFKQHGLAYSVKMEVGGWEVVKKYVQSGLGISIVSGLCLTDEDDLFSAPLAKYFPERRYGVVLRQGRYVSPAAKRFIRLMDPKFDLTHIRNTQLPKAGTLQPAQ